MSTTLKFSLVAALATATALFLSVQVAEAGKKCHKTATRTVAFKKPASADIVETAVGAGSFQTLATALEAARP